MTSLSRFRAPAIIAAGALFATLSLPAGAQPASASLANVAAPSATTTPRQRTPEANGTASSGERQICVREALTGSRMRRRVCKTAREWEAEGGFDSDR